MTNRELFKVSKKRLCELTSQLLRAGNIERGSI